MERIDDLQYKNLKIIQDTEGFRFGIDSVLLTEFARDIKFNSKIVDLGTGTGIISLLLSKKVNPSSITAIEKQSEVAQMAKRSVELNNLEDMISIINKDIMEVNLQKNSFDVVITNPPYKKIGTGINAQNSKLQISRFETTANLNEWIKISSNLLRPKGSFYMVYRTDRLTELFMELKHHELEVKRIRFVHSYLNEQSKLVLVKAIKRGGEFLKVEKPLIIYDENGNYTEEINKIYKNSSN